MSSQAQTILLATVLLAAMSGQPASAQDKEVRTQSYSYDYNRNGVIEPEEFTTYIYERSDFDRDGFLGDEEWTTSTTSYYRPYKDINYNTYTYWDQDKDGHLDSNEVKTLVQKTGLYSKWDSNMNGSLDNEEFARGTFLAYDDNSDGTLTIDEWKGVLR